jgi:ppGpp synthetase/RelA/SpoT-type nucleotidyltranferase
MNISKSKIDKSGLALSKNIYKDEIEFIELEEIFDEYRKAHLLPITETTLELQEWLSNYSHHYYIAQRLKRKPQIISKLQRLHVRLTQLQDIGGARIIVDDNKEVDRLYQHLLEKIAKQKRITMLRTADYRQKGRDITGYRALHLIFSRAGHNLELQIRSRIQHYWAESIERTSVIYGHQLKEQKGDAAVINYFQKLSNIFFEIEAGRDPAPSQKIELDKLRHTSEAIILDSDKHRIFDSYVNEDIIKTLTSIENRKKDVFNNWIIIFDWNTGSFINWDIVDRNPDEAIKAYVKNEKLYPSENGYEVVLIGSSDVATVRQTHSHYFGIETYDNILENLDQAVIGFSKRMDIDTGARQILHCLHRRHAWGSKSIRIPTLKNHFCKNVITFDSSLAVLAEKELVSMSSTNGPVSLNIGKKGEIDQYL